MIFRYSLPCPFKMGSGKIVIVPDLLRLMIFSWLFWATKKVIKERFLQRNLSSFSRKIYAASDGPARD